MQRTIPTYIYAPDLTIREYAKRMINDDCFFYPSVWSWWKKITLYASVPLGIGCIVLFIGILYQELPDLSNTDWILVISLSLLPYMMFMPFVWIVTYHHSFIAPKKIRKRIIDFISDYIPEAVDVKAYGVTNYIVKWKNTEFEIAYNHLDGGYYRPADSFSVLLYYEPKDGTEFEYVNEKRELDYTYNDFEDNWYEFCNNKENCKNLHLSKHAMWAIFNRKRLSSPSEVTDIMNQLLYLVERFNCSPLSPVDTYEEKILRWLHSVDRPTSEDFEAIFIGIIYLRNYGYLLHLVKVHNNDKNDEEWICNENLTPERKCITLYTDKEDIHPEHIQQTVINAVSQYLKTKKTDSTSIFYNRIVSVGYDVNYRARIQIQ